MSHDIISCMSVIVVVDIGGTQIRAAVYPKYSINSIKVKRIATIAGHADILTRMIKLIESVWPEDKVEAISVATAGLIDPDRGVVIDAPNIPGWKSLSLRDKLTEHFNVPIFLGNDANLAALGEWRYGAGRGHHHLLYITISTGIGGGVIIDDQLLEGAHGMAAELGHVVVLPEGSLCSCGVRGHLEAIASGPAIARYVSEQITQGHPSLLTTRPDITARDVADAARLGDKISLDAIHRAGTYLGQAIAGFLHIFNPSIVILGGGVSQSGELLLDPLQESLRCNIMSDAYLNNLQISSAELGDDVGLIGALVRAQIKLEKP